MVLIEVQHWPFFQARDIHGQSKEQKNYKMQSHFLWENDTIDALNMLENSWYARLPTLTVKMTILICFLVQGVYAKPSMFQAASQDERTLTYYPATLRVHVFTWIDGARQLFRKVTC